MNLVDKQVEILNNLASLMIQCPSTTYESLKCRFEIHIEDEFVINEFYYIKDGHEINCSLNDPDFKVVEWVFDLHEAMKLHTGGNWTAFTLIIDEEGQAKTKFEYLED